MDWLYGEKQGRKPGSYEYAMHYLRVDDVPGFPTAYHPQAYQVNCCTVPHTSATHYQRDCGTGRGVCCVLYSRLSRRWFPSDFGGNRIGNDEFATRYEAARAGVLARMGART